MRPTRSEGDGWIDAQVVISCGTSIFVNFYLATDKNMDSYYT